MGTLGQSMMRLCTNLRIAHYTGMAAQHYEVAPETMRSPLYVGPPVEPPKNLPAYQQLKNGKRGKVKKW